MLNVLHTLSKQNSIVLCLYAICSLRMFFEQTAGFAFVNGGEIVFFLCMLAFAFILLAVQDVKTFLFVSVLVGVLPYLTFCIVDRIFFDGFNDGAGSFGLFAICSILFALAGLCIAFVSFVIQLIRRKATRPIKESLFLSVKQLLLIAALAVGAFIASRIVGWGIAKLFWNHIDYEFWNDTAVVEHGAGYSFESVMQDFRALSLFPLFFIALLCVRGTVLARFSAGLRYLALLLLGIFMFISSMSFGWEMPCAWNPLEDTEHTASFNPKQVPLLQVGQTKEEVIALIGEPLAMLKGSTYVALEEADIFEYTGDGASFWADFGWYELSVRFGAEGRLSEITSRWMDD